ncbi:MAG: hypothetical protein F6K25_09340 [Okeania sp. SIO2G4]|nr:MULTISPECIES: hypothetical protein [unclassified Okeania]NEP04636.1 hypothetical protein [Okeania sp. SIO4D6]NEP71239.1 hypothetical protein [Okeania sp. SIO2G5]NEP92152.1 hypothetical protein [Okeania sp. SIO2F5]NEQ90909.1 hypothetical protein [Okeania sp. SIO2G4]
MQKLERDYNLKKETAILETGGKLHGDSLPQVMREHPVDGGVLNPQRK